MAGSRDQFLSILVLRILALRQPTRGEKETFSVGFGSRLSILANLPEVTVYRTVTDYFGERHRVTHEKLG